MTLFGLRSYVHTQNASTIELELKDGSKESFREFVTENVEELQDGTYSLMNPLLFNGDLQTMNAAGSFENIDKVYYGRRLVYWDDGSLVSADYHIPAPTSKEEWTEQLKYCPLENPPPFPSRLRYFTEDEVAAIKDPKAEGKDERPLLVLLHGLSGGSHESYIRSVVNRISGPDYGFDCVVLNSRGCARTPITTPQLFCALWTDDIRRFIKLLRKENPAGRKIYLVGFSLGAAILSNYLGQQGETALLDESEKVDAAVIVANPWDLSHSNQYLNTSLMGHNVYSPVMAKNLLRLLKNHQKVLQKNPTFDYEKRKNVHKIQDFDDAFTAPFFGFDTAKDYYRNASPVHRLMNIRVPSLIINSLDDPVVHQDCIPYIESAKNPYIVLSTTSLGGHIGWFQPGGKRWYPGVISKFFKAFDDNVKATPKFEVFRPKRQLVNSDRLVYN